MSLKPFTIEMLRPRLFYVFVLFVIEIIFYTWNSTSDRWDVSGVDIFMTNLETINSIFAYINVY